MTINRIQRSPLGAFVRSPLGARGQQSDTAIGRIIISGQFTGCVAWYDPDLNEFIFPAAPFSTGSGDSARTIIWHQNKLHIGATTGHIYVYDEQTDTWSTLGAFGNNPRRLVELDGELYTCCDTGVYKWNLTGGTWDLVAGFSEDVRDIFVHKGVLWAIGLFTTPGDRLAYLSGGVWQDGNTGTTFGGTQMWTLYSDGVTLYSARTSFAGFSQDGVWTLNEPGAPTWTRFSTGFPTTEHSRMMKWSGDLYAFGSSNELYIPQPPPAGPTVVASSSSGRPLALADNNTHLLVGGDYTAIDGVPGRIHTYDGSAFTQMGGSEINNAVYDIYIRQ